MGLFDHQPSPNLNVPEDPIGNFAADVDPKLLQDLPANVKPHSTLAFNSPQPTPAWAEEGYNGRLGFIVTLQDKAVSKEAQHLMISATQKDWIVKEMDCSHCAPFLNRIDDCIGLVQGLLREFQSKTT